jgi:ATP-dependent Clp protease ATP-binding subunit ClpA
MIGSSEETEKVLQESVNYAKQFNHVYITTEHLFYALLDDEKLATAIEKAKGDVEAARAICLDVLNNKSNDISGATASPRRTHGFERVFQRAFTQGMFQGQDKIYPINLLSAIENEKQSWAYNIMTTLKWDAKKIAEQYYDTTTESEGDELLAEFCDNFSQRAAEGKIDPVIGREDAVLEIAETLARKTKNNVILLGDPGVGKTAVVECLALKILNKEVPEFLNDHTIWSIDITAMLAGTRYRGEFEERLKQVLDVLKARPNTILFIDEAHMIMGAGSNGKDAIDMGNMLKPMLSRGEIKVIAATTWEDFRKSFEKDRAIQRRFNKVIVDEPSVKDTKKILSGLKNSYEKYHNVKYSADALGAAVDLSVRFITNRKLPDKAIDVIDMAGAQNRTKPVEDRVDKITRDIVINMISKLANVPVSVINSDQKPEENVDLDIKIKKQVFGQDKAVDRVLDSVYVARAGLRTGTRPLANFLFLGPTGCGKCLAGDQNVTVRITDDMYNFAIKNGLLWE